MGESIIRYCSLRNFIMDKVACTMGYLKAVMTSFRQ